MRDLSIVENTEKHLKLSKMEFMHIIKYMNNIEEVNLTSTYYYWKSYSNHLSMASSRSTLQRLMKIFVRDSHTTILVEASLNFSSGLTYLDSDSLRYEW